MQVDTDIVKKLFEVSISVFNFLQVDKKLIRTFDEVCKDVADKKSVDYVGSYELMKHDKLKRECFESATQLQAEDAKTTCLEYFVI
jgi:hypothetical protein